MFRPRQSSNYPMSMGSFAGNDDCLDPSVSTALWLYRMESLRCIGRYRRPQLNRDGECIELSSILIHGSPCLLNECRRIAI